MNCPYCGKEMRLGEIVSDKLLAGICWYPDVKPPYTGENSYVELPLLQQAYYCRDCQMLAIHAERPKEPEGLLKALSDKWHDRKKEKDAEKKQYKKEKQRKKDPWEV